MANKITDSNALVTGLVWVLLRYPDQTEFCFQTTLNTDKLRELGVTLEEGCLVRLDKKYLYHGQMVYRQFRYDGAVISLWDDLHYTDTESQQLHEFM